MNKKLSIYNSIIVIFLIILSSIIVSGFGLKKEFIVLDTGVEYDDYEYHTFQSMTDLLNNIYQNHSDIMDLVSIGKTYEGRDIWLVKISDNVKQQEDEPGVLLMGAHHGNEKPSFEVLIFFIEFIAENYGKEDIDNDHDGLINEDIIDGHDNDHDGLIDEDPSETRLKEIIDKTQIFIIPMVNPDGVEADTRKNRSPNHGRFGLSDEITSYGVNLNRNYGYKWYLYYIFPLRYQLFFNSLDSSFNYRGEFPFSENETIAVKNFVESNDISISASYHSYGEFVFFPWTHTSKKTPDEPLFISIGENITNINGFYLYLGGNYIIPRYGGTLGTSENWLYGERGIIAFTIELCKTRAPTDPQIVYDYCLTDVGVNLYLCERSWSLE